MKAFTDLRFPKKNNSDLTRRLGAFNGIMVLAAVIVGGVSFLLVLLRDSGTLTELAPAAESEKHVHAMQAFQKSYGITVPKLDGANQYSTIIRTPAGPPQVLTGLTDPHGNAVTVSCSTCHATRKPNTDNKTVADMNEFHGSLKFAHGKISCLSCHNANDYDSLKLADGSRIEFTEVITLCGQCHGPQMRDYEHNVHGGMNGHWDLTKGSRQKNNCVDCHNPHSPQFPKMRPTFKPRDRFLDSYPHE